MFWEWQYNLCMKLFLDSTANIKDKSRMNGMPKSVVQKCSSKQESTVPSMWKCFTRDWAVDSTSSTTKSTFAQIDIDDHHSEDTGMGLMSASNVCVSGETSGSFIKSCITFSAVHSFHLSRPTSDGARCMSRYQDALVCFSSSV